VFVLVCSYFRTCGSRAQAAERLRHRRPAGDSLNVISPSSLLSYDSRLKSLDISPSSLALSIYFGACAHPTSGSGGSWDDVVVKVGTGAKGGKAGKKHK
jgi:hypothetical protein